MHLREIVTVQQPLQVKNSNANKACDGVSPHHAQRSLAIRDGVQCAELECYNDDCGETLPS